MRTMILPVFCSLLLYLTGWDSHIGTPCPLYQVRFAAILKTKLVPIIVSIAQDATMLRGFELAGLGGVGVIRVFDTRVTHWEE